jgi:phosphatidylinositol alpha-mannosyltransferase
VKVAVVSPYSFSAWGGVQDQVVGLVEWLRGAGYDAWAIGPGPGGPAGTRHVGRGVTVPGNRSRAPIALAPHTGRRVRDAIVGADVVHIHEPLMPLVGWAALRAPGPARRIGTFHADPPPWVRRAYRLGAPLARRWLEGLDAITAVSSVAAGALDGLAEPEIIPNAVAVAAYEPAPQRRERTVAFVGRDEPRKGLDVLLRAWDSVRDAVPGAHLDVAGARRPDRPGVRFHGRVTEEEKHALLNGSDVFCAPNLGGESFGIILVEGMAGGAAVVASALDSFAAVLDDAGVLVPAGDHAALAEALIDVLTRDGFRRELQTRARMRAARFDRDVVFAQYAALYGGGAAA